MTNLPSTDIGQPCKYKNVIGRIVAHDPSGSSGYVSNSLVDDKEMWSLVEFTTPHSGARFPRCGIFHLHPLNEEEMKQLLEYEEDARSKNALYPFHPNMIKVIEEWSKADILRKSEKIS